MKCGSKDHLQLERFYSFAKGGTSKDSKNIQLLCRSHNLKKKVKKLVDNYLFKRFKIFIWYWLKYLAK